MMRSWLPLLALVGCTTHLDDGSSDVTNVPGTYPVTLDVGGQAREVLIYVPASVPATEAPVVLAFHGGGGNGPGFSMSSGWKQQADASGIIVVFPTALVHCAWDLRDPDVDPLKPSVITKWASGDLGAAGVMPLCSAEDLATLTPDQRALADHPLADDLAFADAILDLLATEHSVDAKRIFLTGFSGGSSYVSLLGAQRSDRFAAVAAAAGPLAVDIVAARAMPTLFTLGEFDPKFVSMLDVAAIPLDESVLDLAKWDEVFLGPYLTELGLDDGYSFDTQEVGGKTLARFRYGSTLTVQIVEGLSHQYANGTNHPLVYAEQMWKFFQQHPLP